MTIPQEGFSQMSFQSLNQVYRGRRRSMTDRREFSYTLHLPERRSGDDRRSGFDRRQTGRKLMGMVPADANITEKPDIINVYTNPDEIVRDLKPAVLIGIRQSS